MITNMLTYLSNIYKEKNVIRFFICYLLCAPLLLSAQPDYTADSKVASFDAPFGYGVNPGYYGDAANGSGFNREGVSYDVALAQLARQVGINTLRPTLPAYFFLAYGNSTSLGANNFEIRTSEFTAYKNMGINNHVVFIGDATDHQNGDNALKLVGNQYRNFTKYSGCDQYPYEFKNMYEPIWDNGENGTPVNDNNYYALYIYKLVSKYNKYIEVYEVVNEIDFLAYIGSETADPSALPSSGKPNWYDRNPYPCELLNWRAPIFSYVRMLRITYEVVKSVDPTAFVAIGGIGYESFLDAVLRNTDNPTDGSVETTNYPKKGGAYFDVLSYHLYPQYDMKLKAANGTNVYPTVYLRYSDEAVDRTVNKKDKFQAVLTKYKYDGTDGNYPLKHFIITETNIPRRTYYGFDYIGSDDAQRNFAVKVMIKAQKKGIKQVHLFKLGESNDITDSTNKEGHEGLYENLKIAKRTSAIKTSAGKAMQTATAMLDSMVYDEAKTTELALPSGVEGAAFKNKAGKYMYVLWARTSVDNSEVAAASYTFPSALGLTSFNRAEWDYSVTSSSTVVSSSTVALTGAPSYFTDASNPISFRTLVDQTFTGVEDEVSNVSSYSGYPNPFEKAVNISFKLENADVISIDILSLQGDFSVKLLNEKNLASGDHSIAFDDLKLPAGLYFAKLYSKKSGYGGIVKLAVE